MQKWTLAVAISFFLIGPYLQGEEIIPSQAPLPTPWFTGNLISSGGTVVPRGSFVFQPYFFATVNYGTFNSHWRARSTPKLTSYIEEFPVWVGMTGWMDCNIFPEVMTNVQEGKSYTGFSDLPLGFSFQILDPEASRFPGIRLIINETLPTGKYQKLSPRKAEVQAIGQGLLATNLSLVFYKLVHLKGIYYFTSTFSVQYSIAPPVHLKGFNSYGGGFGTDGRLSPGNKTNVIYSFEVTLSKHWAFAMDNIYAHTNSNRFSGERGVDEHGNPAEISEVSTEQFSFAPAIEYNLNESLGFMAGAWFAPFGRNSTQFASGVLSLVYTY